MSDCSTEAFRPKKAASLKTCPFCGSKGQLKEVGCVVYVKCSNRKCGAETETYDECDTPHAIEAWNTRYEPTCKLWSALSHQDHSMKYTCMECGHIAAVIEKGGLMDIAALKRKIPNYCPHCGARVIEE